MRMQMHSVKSVTITQNTYGEPVKTYSSPVNVPMFIQWNNRVDNANNGALYTEYDYVALTRKNVSVGSLIDGKYEVGGVEAGRFNRLFLKKVCL